MPFNRAGQVQEQESALVAPNETSRHEHQDVSVDATGCRADGQVQTRAGLAASTGTAPDGLIETGQVTLRTTSLGLQVGGLLADSLQQARQQAEQQAEQHRERQRQ